MPSNFKKDRASLGKETSDDSFPGMLEAVRLVQRARRKGRSIAEFVGQQDMLSGESLNTVGGAFLRLMFPQHAKLDATGRP